MIEINLPDCCITCFHKIFIDGTLCCGITERAPALSIGPWYFVKNNNWCESFEREG
ncbi:hypothetical protein M0R19_05740 [Candidatus Pacearchaeota archaeon]|nr:hypothetical protein [Candidatus Pacearchaeota archaeon]